MSTTGSSTGSNTGQRPEAPDDHQRFSLNEDWTATLIGLVIFTLCMAGLITPELIS